MDPPRMDRLGLRSAPVFTYTLPRQRREVRQPVTVGVGPDESAQEWMRAGVMQIADIHINFWMGGVLIPISIDPEDDDDVVRFLAENPHLFPLVSKVPGAVASAFPEATLRASVYRDPEGEADDELAVYIRTALDPSEALALLAVLDEEILMQLEEESDWRISFNLEYITDEEALAERVPPVEGPRFDAGPLFSYGLPIWFTSAQD